MAKAYYIPSGTLNLASLFPSVDFTDVEDYFVELIDMEDTTMATTPLSRVTLVDPDDNVRLHFLNPLGAIDSLNFKILKKETTPESQSFEQPLSYPLDQTAHAQGRTNVQANRTVNACITDLTEKEMYWIEELFLSPLAWISQNSRQGMPDTYIPIKIMDKVIEPQKEENRHTYEIHVQFMLSHSLFTIRN